MTTKKWRLLVTPLGGNTPLHQLEVESNNWMGALRVARTEVGEEGGVPPGASCSVAPDGAVTILDPASRRRFLLTPLGNVLQTTSDGPKPVEVIAPEAPASVIAVAPVPVQATAPVPAPSPTPSVAASGKKKKFQTVAYMAGVEISGVSSPQPSAAATAGPPAPAALPAPAPQPAAPTAPAPQLQPAPSTATPATTEPNKKKKFETVAFMPNNAPDPVAPIVVGAPAAPAAQAATLPEPAEPVEVPPAAAAEPATATSAPPSARISEQPAPKGLELLLARDEDPTPQNPLTYRERAYLIPRGTSVTEAEAALRFILAELQNAVAAAPRGKFVNLAAFDHRWTEQPERPPLIVLEWRDWRGEALVDYPAAERNTSVMPVESTTDTDERIAQVFEALDELAHMRSAAEALDFAVKLLADAVPSAAVSGCLYDINTDELRFVAVTGPGAAQRQGSATPRGVGLFGLAGRVENAALVIPNARVHPAYHPATDGREGLETQSMLLRPVVHEGHLLAMLQLINRSSGVFSAGDVHVVNYIGDRLGEFLRQVRVRATS